MSYANLTGITGTSFGDHYTFLIISTPVLLKWKKHFRPQLWGKSKHIFMFNNVF